MLISYLVLHLDPFISQSYLLPSKTETGPEYLQLQRESERSSGISVQSVQSLPDVKNNTELLSISPS